MTNRSRSTAFLLLASAIAVTACSPAKKTETAETTTTTTVAVPAAAPAVAETPALVQGIAGLDRVPAPLVGQIASETAPHWARCGDDLVAKVVNADGKDEGFIVARTPSFQFVDATIDVPSQQRGVSSRIGINLRSNSYFQYFGEGVSRTDISGRTVTKAGWGAEQRMTAPLPFWTAEQANGAWTAEFRRNAPDAAVWNKRYVAADCAAVPARTA